MDLMYRASEVLDTLSQGNVESLNCRKNFCQEDMYIIKINSTMQNL